MDAYRVFTLDPVNFPLAKMREFVNYLHEHEQHYVVMVDPGNFLLLSVRNISANIDISGCLSGTFCTKLSPLPQAN
jgi:hypothetical protein